MLRIRASFILALLALWITPLAVVIAQVPTLVSAVTDVNDPEVADYFRATNESLFDLNVHPSLNDQVSELVELVQSISANKNLGSIRVALVDSALPQAYFVKVSEGHNLIAVTMGMLRVIHSKDELAFVLAHEVSHGVSDLQKHIDQKYAATGEQFKDEFNQFVKQLYQRPVENEVDVRSLQYLLDAGLNPNAGPRFLTRILKLGGNSSGADKSHTTLQSRIDTLESTIAYWSRVRGYRILPDEDKYFKPGVVSDLRRQFILSGGYKAYQLPRAEEKILQIAQHIQKIKLRMMQEFWHPYDVVDYYWPKVYELVQGLIEPREIQNLKVKFVVAITNSFETAYEAAIKEQKVGPAHAAQSKMSRNMPDVMRREGDNFTKWKIPAVWLSKFFGVSTLEELPFEIQKLRAERAERFEMAKAALKIEFMKLAQTPNRDFINFFEMLGLIRDGHSKNSKDLIILEDIFAAAEINQIFLTWQTAIENKSENKKVYNSYDLFSMRIRDIELWLTVNPKAASQQIIKAYREFFSGDGKDFKQYRNMSDYFQWALEASRFGAKVRAIALADTTVRTAILSYFERMVKNFFDPEAMHLFSSPTEQLYELAKDTDLGKDKQALGELAVKVLKVMSKGLKVKYSLNPAQAEVVAFVFHPKLFKILEMSGMPIPPARDIFEVLQSIPKDFFDRSNSRQIDFNNLNQIVPGLSKAEANTAIYNLQKHFENEALVFGTTSYDVGAWHSRRTKKNQIGLPPRDYGWVLERRNEGFEAWLEQNHLKDERSRLEALSWSINGGASSAKIDQILLERIERIGRKYQRRSPQERVYRTFHENLETWNPLHWGGRFSAQLFPKFAEKLNLPPLEMIWGFVQYFNQRYQKDSRKIVADNRNDWLFRMSLDYLVQTDLNLIPVEQLQIFILQLFKVVSGSKNLDLIFESVWARTENMPDLRRALSDPKYVDRLYFDDNKNKLANFIVEERFGLSKIRASLKRGAGRVPRHDEIRPEVKAYLDWLKTNFPKPTAVRDKLIHQAMNSFLTSSAETSLLAALKAEGESWMKSEKIMLLDAPELIGRKLDSAAERLSVIESLIGTSDVFEKKLDPGPDGNWREKAYLQSYLNSRRQFREANAPSRSFILQGLMGPLDTGIMGDANSYKRIKDLLLGQMIDRPELVELFDSYLNSISRGQQKVVMGHLLQSFVEGSGRSSGLSAATVFNSMGAFGAKAAQTFRTTGVGGADLQKELDTFFDNALPPERDVIDQELRSVFGNSLLGIFGVRELLGSGSINYVVLCEFAGPNGRKILAAVRIQKSGVVGQVQNENQIWERAIAKLANSKNFESVRNAKLLEEVRASVMTTLRDDGVEFDLSVERDLYQQVRNIYRREARGTGAFSIVPVRPNLKLQEFVPKERQKQVSVYEFVDGVPLAQVTDQKLRHQLGAQIVEIELEAFFKFGAFDRDGHPGNWLVDLKNRRLIRLDYAQFRHVSAEFRESFRKSLGIILRQNLSRSDLKRLAPTFREIFKLESTDQELVQHLGSIVKDSRFPGSGRPHERYFFIRDQLENKLGQTVRFKDEATSALGMLARISLFSGDLAAGTFERKLLSHLNFREQSNLVIDNIIKRVCESLLRR